MSDGWQATVAAARIQKKALYFVETVMGTTVDCTTSLDSARKYIADAARPHLYRIYKLVGRYLTEVT